MRRQGQQPNRSHPGYDYQPVQQGEVEEGQGQQQMSREVAMQRLYEQSGPSLPIGASSGAAVRQGKQREGGGPYGETHPAFRNDPDAIATAM